MAEGWGAKRSVTAFNFAQGLSAARIIAPARQELSATPARAHILAFSLQASSTLSLWMDGRLSHEGPLPRHRPQIVRAGERPRAIASDVFGVLHVYLPAEQLATEAETASGAVAANWS
jgi:hypothetical protein